MALSCTHVTRVCFGACSRKVTVPFELGGPAVRPSNAANSNTTIAHFMSEIICFYDFDASKVQHYLTLCVVVLSLSPLRASAELRACSSAVNLATTACS